MKLLLLLLRYRRRWWRRQLLLSSLGTIRLLGWHGNDMLVMLHRLIVLLLSVVLQRNRCRFDPLVAVLLDVHVQVARLGEAFAAVFADVRLLAGVGVDVNLKLKGQCEQGVTVRTLELLFRRGRALPFALDPFLGVQLGVDAEVARVGKGFLAQLALVGPFAGVGVGVEFKVYGRLEAGLAELTLEAVLGAVLVWAASFPGWPTSAALDETLRREESLGGTRQRMSPFGGNRRHLTLVWSRLLLLLHVLQLDLGLWWPRTVRLLIFATNPRTSLPITQHRLRFLQQTTGRRRTRPGSILLAVSRTLAVLHDRMGMVRILVVFLLGRSATFAPKIRKLVRMTVRRSVMILYLRPKLSSPTAHRMSHAVLSVMVVMINAIARLVHRVPLVRPSALLWVVPTTVNRRYLQLPVWMDYLWRRSSGRLNDLLFRVSDHLVVRNNGHGSRRCRIIARSWIVAARWLRRRLLLLEIVRDAADDFVVFDALPPELVELVEAGLADCAEGRGDAVEGRDLELVKIVFFIFMWISFDFYIN